jgi:hypothetical protein
MAFAISLVDAKGVPEPITWVEIFISVAD